MRVLKLMAFFLCLITLQLEAKQIDVATAERVALNFIRLKTIDPGIKSVNKLTWAYTETSKAISPITAAEAQNYFYIFNIGTKGFIIVSADDCVIPVTAYSSESNYSASEAPPQVIKWLESYKSQVRFAIESKLEATEEIKNEWKTLNTGIESTETNGQSSKRGSVSPLVAAKWNQTNYYNNSCPYDNTYNQRTVTGCVATAMAQVMKYWNYPPKGTGSHSYSHNTYGTLSANFGATTYNWSSMPNSVNSTNSSVATLMYHLGVSVDMNYNVSSKGGSGAFVVSAASPVTHCTEYALKTYFGYKTSLSGKLRNNYTTSQWMSLIKGELDASRPIVYAGFGNGGGHCFVADGYDNNDYIHFNWGWGGAYDGYFQINALNPGGVGTGGGTGGFNSNHQAVVGIEPISGGGGGSNNLDLRLYADVDVNPDPIQYNQAFTVTTNVANYGTSSAQNFTGDYCAAVFNSNDEFIDYVEIKTGYTLEFNKYYVNPLVFSNSGMSEMTPGTYKIGIYYRPNGASTWTSLDDGSYQNFISVQVKGNDVNDLKLYAAITVNPSVLVQDQTFTVTFDVANYSNSEFNGSISVDIHESNGKWIKELSVKDGLSLPKLTHFTNGLTYTITGGLDLEPGTYQFFVWDKPDGGDWEFLGSGNFSNPINVQLVAPGLDPDMYENNNVLGQSYNLPMTFQGNTAKRTTTGSNCHDGGDYDYYKITLPAGFDYTINARLHDAYSSGNGNSYTLDALVSYSTDGTTWSDAFDDVITQFNQSGAGTIYFLVSPYFTGSTGTYLFDVNVSRTAQTGLSKKEKLNNSILVYPNPAKDFLVIDLKEHGQNNGSLIIYNTAGQQVIQAEIEQMETHLSIAELKAGIYIIEVKTALGVMSKSIIVQ